MYHLVKSIYLHATSLPEYSILLLGLDAAGKTTLLNQIRNLYGVDAAGPETSVGGKSAGSGTKGVPSESAGKTVPTVGQNVCTIQAPQRLYLRIWDIGGQQSLRRLWPSYYSSCHAIVFVIDSTDLGDCDISQLPEIDPSLDPGSAYRPDEPSSRNNKRRSIAAAEEDGRLGECAALLSSVLADSSTAGVPLLVLANKQDREDSVEVVKIKERFVRKVVEGDGGHGYARGQDYEGAGAYVRDSRVLPCSALSGQGVKEAVDWVATRAEWNKEARPPVMR